MTLSPHSASVLRELDEFKNPEVFLRLPPHRYAVAMVIEQSGCPSTGDLTYRHLGFISKLLLELHEMTQRLHSLTKTRDEWFDHYGYPSTHHRVIETIPRWEAAKVPLGQRLTRGEFDDLFFG